jgi:uncharacterized protein YecT (DUF1311 family)
MTCGLASARFWLIITKVERKDRLQRDDHRQQAERIVLDAEPDPARQLEPQQEDIVVMETRNRILANVGLVGAILWMATAASAGAATLKPPVIKEVFTPLQCIHDGTTLGMEGCAEQQILNSDRTIDSVNGKIFTKLSSSGKKDFINGHNAWFKYRTAYCLSESDVYHGGTEAGVIDAQCTANINRVHLKELQGFLSSLNQN